ncbi:TBC1 domain family member 1 isoform X2 [Bacillus rossius redtenbacheri]|uniref:TBC1 domain family member 1 isoform X2 n=1 Tax=Bacillus rossius redtenbacheri TaxID=93214 RepID=UPI002FDD7412
MSGDMSSDMSAARRFASHSDASGVRSSRTMTELLNSFKESNKDRSSSPVSASPVSSLSASSPTSAAVTTLGVDICSSASHFFEVLYIGKIKVSHKRVPDTFIDDALEKFQSHELEKNRSRLVKSTSDFGSRQIPQMPSLLQTIGSSEHVSISPSSSVNSVDTDNATGSFSGSVESLPYRESQQNITEEPIRDRAASTGCENDLKKPGKKDYNRTMLFQVGRTDLCIISPDRKQVLLHKQLKDVATCIQGVVHGEYFGFICREPNMDSYVGYVFKCENESFADEVVVAITQSFMTTSEAQRREKPPVLSCEHCPLVWYHKLCADIEGLGEKRAQAIIIRRLDSLPEEEQALVLEKFRGIEVNTVQEQNEMLMILLRAHCEAKQTRHVHDTPENRSEFLNQYLGGSTIFMKAKRSLTSSFDQLLKRKSSRDDFGPIVKEVSLPMNAALCKEPVPLTPTESATDSDEIPNEMRPRSLTVGSLGTGTPKRENSLLVPKTSPMMNIFLKVGNSPKSSTPNSPGTPAQPGSWRQAIFNRVVTPLKNVSDDVARHNFPRTKREASELRALWRKAINQQLLLIRMEKENTRLRVRQEEATVKRIKLEYDEIGSCLREGMEVWDLLTSKESRKCDRQMLLQAIRQGVPRSKRGEIWQFLAEQYCLKQPPIDTTNFPNYHVPYEKLLHQLTSYQHSIIIDLGRTFPNHVYFASPLGPGQLSLFNLLKAYSLLDPEVGYCQGLSFVAGILLLHMAEESAFLMLRHLMFRRGLRNQYLPDMVALQIQLYQVSRLLHDYHPDLYSHFDANEITPTLYAAPWILTIFASQFPLGFVTRVFDLLFVESHEVIFRVAVALLGEHKAGLMECESFEGIMHYLKVTLPNVDKNILDKVMKQVFSMDIKTKLHEYEVEYQVLQEEINNSRVEAEVLKQLQDENQALTHQLQIAANNLECLGKTQTAQQNSIHRLEAQIRSLEVSVETMGHFISDLVDTRKDIDIPGDVRRIVSQLITAQRRKSRPEEPTHFKSSDKGLVGGNHRAMPYPLKTAQSSPNLGLTLPGVSTLPCGSQGYLKTKKAGSSAATLMSSPSAVSLTKDSIGNRTVAAGVETPSHKSFDISNGDRLSKQIESQFPHDPKSKLKSHQSSFELHSTSSKVEEEDSSATHIHPLDSCSGVSFTFGGTTKLKTIKPVRAMSAQSLTLKSHLPDGKKCNSENKTSFCDNFNIPATKIQNKKNCDS